MSGPARRISIVIATGLCALISLQSLAASPRPAGLSRTAKNRLDARLKAVLGHPELAQATTGVKIVSLLSGETFFSYQAEKLFHPASNTKLFTAVSALRTLGRDYRFLTRLYGDDGLWIRNDTLFTALYLYGVGDPLLNTDDVDSLAGLIAGYSVRTISGDLVVDDGYFDDIRLGEGWMWDDVGFDFSAQVTAMTLNLNCVTAIVTPGDSAGAPVRVRLDPPTAYVDVVIAAWTGPPGSPPSLKVERRWKDRLNVLDVSGELPKDAPERRLAFTVEDPALYTVTVLRERLAAHGVSIAGKTLRGRTPLRVRVLAAHESAPLTEAIAFMLRESDNLTAELLLKATGRYRSGQPGAAADGLAALRRTLTTLAGIDTLSYRFSDGSGLSWYNLVTPDQTVALLTAAHRDSTLRAPLWDALPVAGVDGTLKNRMRSSPASGVLRAKTGALSGVSCLSGFVNTRDGEPLVFSIMINNYAGSSAAARRAQDDIGAILATFSRKEQE